MSIKFLLVILILFAGILIGIGVYLLNKSDSASVTQITNPSTNSQETTDTEVVLTGKEDGGVRLGVLKPNESCTISYVSGKIISNNKNGFTAEIWGVPIKETDPAWIPLMPYAQEGMWTNAIFVDTGSKRNPFKEGQYELKIKNETSQEQTLYLRFHEARGYYSDNEGEVRFRLKKEIGSSNQIPQSTSQVTTVIIKGTDKWKGSGIKVQSGQRISISASGSVVWDEDKPAVDPNGTFPANTLQQPSDFPMPDAGCGSLVMRIGLTKYAVGASDTVVATESGNIEFIVNDRISYLYNNSGSFTVQVETK
jgi:hypothetical protein